MGNLNFYISVTRTRFVTHCFGARNVPSVTLANSSPSRRHGTTGRQLISKRLHFLFIISVCGRNISVPRIGAILFLHPARSLAIFLRRLKHNLHLTRGGSYLAILSFVKRTGGGCGFRRGFTTLLSGAAHDIDQRLGRNFISTPGNYCVRLRGVTTGCILSGVDTSCSHASKLITQTTTFARSANLPLALKGFLSCCRLSPHTVCDGGIYFDELYIHTKTTSSFTRPLRRAVAGTLTHFTIISSHE